MSFSASYFSLVLLSFLDWIIHFLQLIMQILNVFFDRTLNNINKVLKC